MQRYQEPELMTREQRMLEVAAILAAGYLRLREHQPVEHAGLEDVETPQN